MSTPAQRSAPSQSPLTGPGRLRPATHLARAALAVVKNGGRARQSALDSAIRMYPADPVTPRLLLRGASAPATIASSTWAGAVAAEVVVDFVSSLTPESAAARLIDAGLRLSLDGVYEISLPRRNAPPAGDDVWVTEGNPIPVKRYTLEADLLGPVRKLASIVMLTRELAEHSTAENVIRTLLQEDMAASLDVSMFSTAAASAARPAGLLNGVTPITATTGAGFAAMAADLQALAGAIADAGGGSVVYIANPKLALAASLLGNANPEIVVWPCRALAAGTIIAVEPRAFASGFGPFPEIEVGSHVTVHMENASPAAIGTAGSPNVVAAPVRSAFQTDSLALKTTLDAAWSMRAPGMVQYITGAAWGTS